jgi:hypothetical protein
VVFAGGTRRRVAVLKRRHVCAVQNFHHAQEKVSFEFFGNLPRGNERSGQKATVHGVHE